MSLSWDPRNGMAFHGTICPARDFDAEKTAEKLELAMKGVGCNKQKVIEALISINNAQRQMVRTPYKTKYGKDLEEELKKELSGDLEDVIIALIHTPTKEDVIQLHKAVKGFGTKEKVIIELLCSRTNEEITAIRNTYQTTYNRNLEQDIAGDTSGTLKRLLVSLIQGNRSESYEVDSVKANQDARRLLNAGEKKVGTDEDPFVEILASQSYRQLDRVFLEYEKITGHTLDKAIEKEFSGNAKQAFLTVYHVCQNKPKYFATQINNACKGLGTRDKDLIRVIVSRAELDLAAVKDEFQRLYGKTVEELIKGDCSGAYRDALLAIVKGNAAY